GRRAGLTRRFWRPTTVGWQSTLTSWSGITRANTLPCIGISSWRLANPIKRVSRQPRRKGFRKRPLRSKSPGSRAWKPSFESTLPMPAKGTTCFAYKLAVGRLSPVASVGIAVNGQWRVAELYVDSGAFYTLLHAQFAKDFGLDYERGRKALVQVGDGSL